AGLDPASDLIPVAPAAHYQCGGVVTDPHGRPAVPGRYAAGEVARTGLHSIVCALRIRRRPPVLGAVPDRAPAAREPRPARDTAPAVPNGLRAATAIGRPELDEFDARLLRMLKTSMTVAEIARQNYLSERSMYRRIRNLYDVLGVAGRNDLVNSGAHDQARAPLTVLRG
ncbi:FAD-binding protein, partial [Nocardia brasiliensis]|uniref:FAD-binding protein n=1 Tax=Nocardia brasiliensis TaxID=37326 RepID=UPI002458EA9A